LRQLVWFTFACVVVVSASFAHAQEANFAVGGSTLFSSSSISASQAFLPPGEKGGVYPSLSAQVLLKEQYGFNVETAFRYKQGLYDGYQHYRPVFYDVNAVYAPRASGDFMAGIGGESLIFYNQFDNCFSGACATNVNSTHFLLHLGGDVRYRFIGHVFVRPEAHYYRILNNHEFHSDNVLRVGASIGYTFGQ
jgi:hypothetical protein